MVRNNDLDNNIILSICIPTYNRKDIVCENVRKMLRYNGNDIEIIVNDNASEDGTVEALEQMRDERLKVYRNEINIGAAGNYMQVLMRATGKYAMLVNDRDYVEHKDIQDFVDEYRSRECDVIMAINDEGMFKKNVGHIEGRTYMFLYFCHPGEIITGKKINEKLRERQTGIYNEEWAVDVSNHREALCVYAKRWECYKYLIKWPERDQLVKIVQLRDKSSSVRRIYFTPDSRLYRFERRLDNQYIHKENTDAYVCGTYRTNIFYSLTVFYRDRMDPYIRERYNYNPDEVVCWIMTAIKFYKESMKILKKKGMYTFGLAMNLGLITIKEYLRLCKNIVISMKKKIFPKPWYEYKK